MGQEYSTIDPTLLVAQTTWVRSLANHLVRDPDGAEDVVQETLLAALSSPPRDAADAKRLRAWLGRVAFNLAHLSRRRNSRRRVREERAAQSESQRSAAESYVARTVQGLLSEAVDALEEPYRTAVKLRYFEGLTTAEVAEETGTTNSAVRKRLWRARARLRRELDRLHNGERHAWFRALAPLAPLAQAGSKETVVPGSGSFAAGIGWKLAAALPLLALGALVGRALLDPADQVPVERGLEVAGAPPSSAEAASTRVELPVRDDADAGGSGAAPEPRPPRVRLRVVPGERDSDRERSAGHEVHGHVIDLWGHPLGGVELVSGADPENALGRTGANGSFTIRVPELPVTLDARAAGYATLHTAHVEPGAEAWQQWLVAAPAVAVSGTVLDPDGEAVADADVQVVYDESAFVELPVLLDFMVPKPGKITDASGSFAFDAVPTGAGIYLRVRHERFATYLQRVPPVPTHGLEIRMSRAKELRTLAGVVLDQDQRPLPGVEVVLGEATTTTSELGAFSLQSTARASTQIVARKDGYESVRMQAERSGSFQHLRLVMQVADRDAQGEVLDEEGRPLEGWIVFALPERGEAPVQEEATAVAQSRSGDDGSFRLEGLTRAAYSIFGVDPATLLMTEARSIRGGAAGVQLRAEKAEVATLFAGRVVGRDRRPVPDAVVQAELRIPTERGTFVAQSARARTDLDGRFALSRLAARHARIRIDHPSVHSVLPAPQGRAGDARPHEFVVDVLRPVRFSGAADFVMVLDASGCPLPLHGFAARHTRAPLSRGRSSLVGVGSEACTVVWYRDGAEVGRDLLRLDGDEPTEIER